MTVKKQKRDITLSTYRETAIPHLVSVLEKNKKTLSKVTTRLVKQVKAKGSLYVAGSGHSTIFALELYHRAGGPSFVIPVIPDYLIPTVSGPSVVRVLERTSGTLSVALRQAQPRAGEMIWICSQSGINPSIVDLALESKKQGLTVVAFTSVSHSQAVESRHESGKRLFEVSDEVIDLYGVQGDAAIEVAPHVKAGPLSSLTAIFLAHSILLPVLSLLEKQGVRCTYTSVNTREGDLRNRKIEAQASKRDWRLR